MQVSCKTILIIRCDRKTVVCDKKDHKFKANNYSKAKNRAIDLGWRFTGFAKKEYHICPDCWKYKPNKYDEVKKVVETNT